jgi:hypothetical protein
MLNAIPKFVSQRIEHCVGSSQTKYICPAAVSEKLDTQICFRSQPTFDQVLLCRPASSLKDGLGQGIS